MLAWLSVWSEVQTCPADKIGFTFVLPAHPGSPDKQPLNGCVCVCVTPQNQNGNWQWPLRWSAAMLMQYNFLNAAY